jgi:hypothetical protein
VETDHEEHRESPETVEIETPAVVHRGQGIRVSVFEAYGGTGAAVSD